MSQILSQRGHPPLVLRASVDERAVLQRTPPRNYRDWATSDYTFYEALAPHLHELGVLCEPDSREPWFVCEAHDERCLGETLHSFEEAVDRVVQAAEPRALLAAPCSYFHFTVLGALL